MRKLRFRLWDYALNLMDYSGLWSIGFDGRLYYGNAEFSDYKVTVMECTGLKDANGTEIYKADIVTLTLQGSCSEFPTDEDLKPQVYTGKVVFDNGYKVQTDDYCPSLTNYLVKSIVVIGNIFENKDLLGGSYE